MKTVTCKFCDYDREVFTGSEIQLFRKRNRLTLKKMAELFGISTAFINDCEHDRRNLSSRLTAKMTLYDLRTMVFKSPSHAG